MKNKGFTLIELLGVIIILALLMIIVFPSIINSVKNSSNKTDDLTKELIYNAANLFIDDHINDFPKMNGSKYSIELSTLVGEGLLTGPIKLSGSDLDITNNKCIQVTYNNGYNYELKDSGTCKEIIKYSLPEEYQQVEYIESTGTQYIDTGVKLTQNHSLEIQIKDFDTNGNRKVFGSRSSATSNNFSVVSGPVGGTMSIVADFYNYQNNRLAYVINNNEKLNILINNNLLKINNLEHNVTTYSNFETPGTAYLFNANGSYPDGYIMAIMKLYSCKIYDSDVIIRQLVPCYRKSDNVIGMYDIVNNVFYTNAGTGEFKKGDNV